MDYHDVPQPSGSGAGKRKAFGGICNWVVGPAGMPQYPLLYVFALERQLRRLRDEGENPALRDVPFAGPLIVRVSAFTDDINVFGSRLLDIEAVKKAVTGYERIAGAKVNFDKSEGLRLSSKTGSDTLKGPLRWSDASSGCGLGLTSN